MQSQPEKKALGQGLSALIQATSSSINETSSVNSNSSVPSEAILQISLDKIKPNSFQPRQKFDDETIDELAASIKENGVLQPISVRKINDDEFEIIAGERRYRACQKNGLPTIPAIIKNANDEQMLELAIIENLQRENLNAIEEASALSKLMTSFGHTQEKVAQIVGKSRSYVANAVRLLTLPDAVQTFIKEDLLTAGHARALVGKSNALELAQNAITNKLNVRQMEALASGQQPKPLITQNSKNPYIVHEKDSDLIEIEKGLSEALGMRVYIRDTSHGGQVIINFNGLEQLDAIIQRIGGANLNF